MPKGRPMGTYTKWSPERLAMVKSLRLRGYSIREIAEVFNETHSAVKSTMQRKTGFPSRRDIAKSAWQTIDTAPELTFILIYEEGRFHVAQFEVTDLDAHLDEPMMLWGFVDGWMDPEIDFSPTHWMPLPEPPK